MDVSRERPTVARSRTRLHFATGATRKMRPAELSVSSHSAPSGPWRTSRIRSFRFCSRRSSDVTALPFADASFDTVVCTLAACTFGDPLAAFREMRRVCRPGGSVLLLEHVLPRDRVLARLAETLAPMSRKAVGCNPNRDTLALVREAGLQVVSVRGRMRDIVLSVVARP